MIGRPRIVSRGGEQRDEIALTFDDGPSAWTMEIAAIFERHGCHTTFFLRGPAVEERPEEVAALAAGGHELGNHLWSHSNSETLSRDELRAELSRTANAIQAAGGGCPSLIRPPYLRGPEKVADAATGCGVSAIVLGSMGIPDWIASSADEIVEPVLTAAAPGDIVCLHDGVSPDRPDTDTRAPTAEAARQLVPALLERGLRPVTVSLLLAGD
ncbi:MAG TPA: polysaccharide deacetylase family protein [Solirubrobacterales bacterium]|nr:polysaccharide deacetylase family protein [Solirubrobacterales bacterium]